MRRTEVRPITWLADNRGLKIAATLSSRLAWSPHHFQVTSYAFIFGVASGAMERAYHVLRQSGTTVWGEESNEPLRRLVALSG